MDPECDTLTTTPPRHPCPYPAANDTAYYVGLLNVICSGQQNKISLHTITAANDEISLLQGMQAT